MERKFELFTLFYHVTRVQADFYKKKVLTSITTTTTKPYPTKWGRLHGSNYVIVFYHKLNLDPTN